MKNQASRRALAQKGSVFVLIFVMIALFGALSFVVAKSFRGGGVAITKDRAQITASELMNYGFQAQQAVRAMVVSSGCTDVTINLYNVSPAHAANATAPADKSCNLFDAAGGGINYYVNPSAASGAYRLFFVAQYNVKGLGADTSNCGSPYSCTELLLGIDNIPKEVCMAINAKLDIVQAGKDTPEYFSINTGTPWNYIYSNSVVLGNADMSGVAGQRAACFYQTGTAPPKYTFYQALFVR